jgi:hypothetical protein
LALLLACGGSAQACSRVIQITLEFPEGSAQLESKQIARLANWLAEARGWFRYQDADVEGVAVGVTQGGKELARHRAEVATRALRSLHDGLPVHTSSHAYPAAYVRSNGNYAVVQLNPTDAPDCNPVPIPGFKY